MARNNNDDRPADPVKTNDVIDMEERARATELDDVHVGGAHGAAAGRGAGGAARGRPPPRPFDGLDLPHNFGKRCAASACCAITTALFALGVYWCVVESPGSAWPPYMELQLCCSDVDPVSGGCRNYYSALSCTSFFNSNGSLAFTAQQETVPYVWNVGDYSDKQPYNAKLFCPELVESCSITLSVKQGRTTVMPEASITMSEDNEQSTDSENSVDPYVQPVQATLCTWSSDYITSFLMYENSDADGVDRDLITDPEEPLTIHVSSISISDPANVMGLTAWGYPRVRPFMWFMPEGVNGLFLAGILMAVFLGVGMLGMWFVCILAIKDDL